MTPDFLLDRFQKTLGTQESVKLSSENGEPYIVIAPIHLDTSGQFVWESSPTSVRLAGVLDRRSHDLGKALLSLLKGPKGTAVYEGAYLGLPELGTSQRQIEIRAGAITKNNLPMVLDMIAMSPVADMLAAKPEISEAKPSDRETSMAIRVVPSRRPLWRKATPV